MTIWATRLLWGIATAAAIVVAVGSLLGDNSPDDFAPANVLVATQTIPAGTPGTTVAAEQMFTATMLPRGEVLEGAIADATFLTGRAASVDLLPGQQLTADLFADISP